MRKLLLITASLLLATSALAYDRKEQGKAQLFRGFCNKLTVGGEQTPLCGKVLRVWFSNDFNRAVFFTSSAQSDESNPTYYEFYSGRTFITPKGEPDTFLIDEVHLSRKFGGKDTMISDDHVTGKCVSLIEEGKNDADAKTIYFTCKISGQKIPAIEFKFSGKNIPAKPSEVGEKGGGRGSKTE